MEIFQMLDQSNCRECGKKTCLAFAGAVFLGKKKLIECPKLDADMIVMGNSIRSIWMRKVLGDTVLNTLTRADRPLFLSQ